MESTTATTVESLEQALDLARGLGYRVRLEMLGGGNGGDCTLRGQKWIFLDLADSSLDHLRQIRELLARESAMPSCC